MRAVTLSDPRVFQSLRSEFVCGFKNISDEPYCGKSGAHNPDEAAIWTTNGAGPRNTQIFLLDADGTVLECLPGFWAPDDLLCEIGFAKGLDKVWHDGNRSPSQKSGAFVSAQLLHLKAHSQAMMERSHLQSFDAQEEMKDAQSDLFYKDGEFKPSFDLMNGVSRKFPELKTVDQLVHERMAKRPFVNYDQFDVAAYVDYGKRRYDKHEEDRFEGKGKFDKTNTTKTR